MRCLATVALLSFFSGSGMAQTDFEVSGTPIPPTLLRQNYGHVPKGISAFDLSICNVTGTKQSLVSSQVYQALASQTSTLKPIGRDIILGALIHSQSHSPSQTIRIVFETTTGILSLLAASRYPLSPALVTATAFGSLAGQQLINRLIPIFSGDQLEKFESHVLEPALVLDAGSCVERTVFVTSIEKGNEKARNLTPADSLSFHIH